MSSVRVEDSSTELIPMKIGTRNDKVFIQKIPGNPQASRNDG